MDTITPYKKAFDTLQSSLNGNQPEQLKQIREAAIAELEKQGIPHRKTEAWKYTNIRPVLKEVSLELLPDKEVKELDYDALERLSPHRLVFVNGVWSEPLSRLAVDGVEVQPLHEALTNDSSLLDYYNVIAGNDKEPFTALNTALANSGTLIRITKNLPREKPLLVIHLYTEEASGQLLQNRNLVLVSPNVEASIIEDHQQLDNSTPLQNQVNEWFIADNAKLTHYKLQLEESSYNHITDNTVKVAKDARYTHFTLNFGGRVVRNNIRTILQTTGAEAELYGLSVLHEKSHVDNNILVEHAAPGCYSNQLFKGLLDDRSTGVFNGRILVHKDAQQTNAYQSNRNLLLSDNATINTKPQLVIYADDVKCSHGATTGKMDQTALFYLRSRGIPEAKAKALLNLAFAGEIIDKIKLPALQELLNEKLNARFQL